MVVFLDSNISVGIALYLSALRRYAHWISFDNLERAVGQRSSGAVYYKYNKSQRRKIRDFFDRTGDQNLFDREAPPPYKMKDEELLNYIASLMDEVYPSRTLYVFYTFDKKFLIQDSLRNHSRLAIFNKESLVPEILKKYPHLSILNDGPLYYCPMDSPSKKGKLRDVAEAIRKDFLERMGKIMLS